MVADVTLRQSKPILQESPWPKIPCPKTSLKSIRRKWMIQNTGVAIAATGMDVVIIGDDHIGADAIGDDTIGNLAKLNAFCMISM